MDILINPYCNNPWLFYFQRSNITYSIDRNWGNYDRISIDKLEVMRLKIITELLFIIPLALALFKGLYFYSFIIAISILTAMLYHSNNEKKYFLIDVIASSTLISTNLYFVYLSTFKYPYFHLALVALAFSVYFWIRAQKKNYDFNHSMWHIASAMITGFCLMAYIV